MKTTACVQPIRSMSDILELESRPYDELVPARSVHEVFVVTAALHGERPALTVLRSADPGDVGLQLDHAGLLAEVTRAANLFSSLGIGDSDVVCIVAKTYARVPGLIWGAEIAGVVSCLNYMLAADVLAELMLVEACKVLVCPGPDVDPELWSKLGAVIDRVPSIQTVLVIGRPDREDPRLITVEDALAAQTGSALTMARRIDRDTRAALFHTGGTTGVPKLVPHTHGNQIHAAWSFAQAFAITEADVGLNGLPMFHVGGTSTWGLSILAAGGHVVVMGPVGYRDPSMVRNLWAIAAHYKATMTGSVPTTIGAMSEIPVGGSDISTLRMAQTGGAVLPRAVAERFEARAGILLLEQYGMTETVATIASTSFAGSHVRGSVGLRCPFSEVRVVHNTSVQGGPQDAAPGEIGAVICRGLQVVSGYVSERHTRGAFLPGGWLVTGDLGYLREDGALVLTGREKDLIIRSGHNIDPAAIEEVANAHPSVAACAAVGMPDAYAGEIPVLFAVPMAGGRISVDELAAYLQANIPEPPAKPRHIFVVDALPTTTVGKIFKPDLRERAIFEKLRMELKAVNPLARLERIELTTKSEGRLVVTASLARVTPTEDVRTEQALLAAVRDLTFDTVIEWI